MSCNPSVGGVAKGNIVREIDALGGVMARLTDATGIHFRMLNRSKGMAVWGNRAQADKHAYRVAARRILEAQPTLDLLQGMVCRVETTGPSVSAVVLDSGERIDCRAVALCMGTFLNGLAHIGMESFPAGRTGEPPSLGLTESLSALGVRTGRLKTGTSPRIDGRSVDYSRMAAQPGDDDPWAFSFSAEQMPTNRVQCWITRSSPLTHRIIRDNLDRSPLYGGKVTSIGPRYCPSIEDKVVRFGDREGHTLFLEPEGVDVDEMYLNGLSTSLPFDVQVRMVASVPGLEHAKIVRPGYAIEYDYFPPDQLWPTLESKVVENLYFAGQINGTSGYEEAACQGLVAGINVAQRVLGKPPFLLSRQVAYAGVLIDDLVTRGTSEPYRMFTSRAEHRLVLRQDNADQRLMPEAAAAGLLDPGVLERRQRVWDERRGWDTVLAERSVDPETWRQSGVGEEIRQAVRARELLRRPAVTIGRILAALHETIDERDVWASLEADIKYEGFVARQQADIERQRGSQDIGIPANIEYGAIGGLLIETRAKLAKTRPATVRLAAAIPGVTPADIGVLLGYLSRSTGRPNIVSRETADQ